MGSYVYIARDTGGLRREGVLPAATPNEALDILHHRGLTPISIEETAAQKKQRQRAVAGGGRVKSAELAALSWQLSTMVEGGIAITTALEIVAGDTTNAQLKVVLHRTLAKVSEGRPLSDGLKEFPHIFARIAIAIVVAGETSGNLAQALQTLAEYFESRDRLIRKVKGALAYPVFVLVLITSIVAAIMVFVVPRFRAIFDQLGGKLPAFTRAFMQFHDLLSHNALYLIVAVAVLTGAGVVFSRTGKGHKVLSQVVLGLPLFGRLISEAFVATFCSTIAMLLESGVPVLDAFEILRGMTSNDVIDSAIATTKQHITGGSNIAISMAAAGFFPNMVVKMTQVGEESGSLAAVLRKTSEHYERRLTSTIDTLTGLLEPLMIVVIGAIVLVAVVALYLPVFTISDMAG
ncbi:MAG: type II secretion system F family protein [Sedimentisphaerales bacterium]|nr:type II secretion system F family protein [Sedimentisphaerales bacterium]